MVDSAFIIFYFLAFSSLKVYAMVFLFYETTEEKIISHEIIKPMIATLPQIEEIHSHICEISV